MFGSDVKAMTISGYYEWYRVPVQRWLNMSKYKAMRRIKKAVDLDKVTSPRPEPAGLHACCLSVQNIHVDIVSVSIVFCRLTPSVSITLHVSLP